MKRLLLVLLFFALTFPLFSQEPILIGNRLKYEIRNDHIYITDIYDNKNIRFGFQHSVEYFFRIDNWLSHVGIADIYTIEFSRTISQFITTWSVINGGHDVWRVNATNIANRITVYMRNRFPRRDQQPDSVVALSFNPSLHDSTVSPVRSVSLITQLQAGMYYVQIGAFSNIHFVYPETEKIDRNLPVAVMQATVLINGIESIVNRVLIGPLNYENSVLVLRQYRNIFHDAFVWYGR